MKCETERLRGLGLAKKQGNFAGRQLSIAKQRA